MTSSLPPTAVIFDVDGTLADTNYLHVVSWARAFRDVGENVAMSDIHRLIGMGSDLLVERLIGRPSDDAADGHSKHFRELMAEIRAFPGAADLLVEVHRRGAVVALASSANSEQLEAMLEAIDAPDGTIDHIVGKDDVERSKPEPDIFAAALEKTGCDAAGTLVVGDTVWDVEAAEKLGLEVVGVVTGGIDRCELEEAGAIAVYDDVAQILDQLDQTPIGRLLQPPTSRSTNSRS
jgi:HAD superfamily hydrolase (TIGR01509 family)